MDLWKLIDLAESTPVDADAPLGVEEALKILKPTRRECEIIARQSATVCARIREVLDNSEFGKLAAQTTEVVHPVSGKKVVVSFGSDSHFSDFLSWIVSQGRETCLQLVSDPDSMMPVSGNFSLFEETEGTDHWILKADEGYMYPLDVYWMDNFLHPIDPDYDEVIDTYYEYPLSGFVDRAPEGKRTVADMLKMRKLYENSIVILSTEKSATAHYDILNQKLRVGEP